MRFAKMFLLFSIFPLMAQAQVISPSYRVALVDTGYDICNTTSGSHCENNKNLLFRGGQPLDDSDGYLYHADLLRESMYSYLQEFKQTYKTKSALPTSLAELSQYRIVIINLLYDWQDHGSTAEFDELTYEFKNSGASVLLEVPEQHKIYNLVSAFNPNQYAFEWWPITLPGNSAENITGNINWPNKAIFSVPKSQQFYKPINLTYFISGVNYQDVYEDDQAKDLLSLLLTQPSDGHPLLIYYHCVAGKDRTGAVTLSYLMQHGGYGNVSMNNALTKLSRHSPASFTEAYQLVTQTNYPKPKEDALRTAQSYCLNLKKQVKDCER